MDRKEFHNSEFVSRLKKEEKSWIEKFTEATQALSPAVQQAALNDPRPSFGQVGHSLLTKDMENTLKRLWKENLGKKK